MNPIFKKQRDKLFHLKTLRRGPAEDSSKSAAQQKGQVCPFCGHVCTQEELQKQMLVCRCGHHFAMDAYTRLHLVLDEGSLYEMGKAMKTADWLHFPGYPQKLKAQREKSHLEEGVVTVITLTILPMRICMFSTCSSTNAAHMAIMRTMYPWWSPSWTLGL